MGINIGTRGKNDPDLVFATDIGTGSNNFQSNLSASLLNCLEEGTLFA